MESKDDLYQRASFGKQVDQFWSSQIGEYLLNRAKEEYTAALVGLKTCDPGDFKGISRLQGEIWRAESFEVWLSEAIMDGIKSLDLLENDEDGPG